ncbi:hypothetical protein AMS68_000772 [Peltaster fructicola]|uniref:Malate dehydrogenase n=1 Tax=Peltaster fructicola TaxID=286661 RepID=A0A6H0XKV6_9PEZI|nr:hypothetical protein AMS68_000772 [Peltaster fructicola]
MSSIRYILTIGALLTVAFAAPHNLSDTADAPALPSSSLPPPTGLTLKVIALGVGHQNYTCNSTSGKFSSNVALADLFDATRYLSKHKDEVDSITYDRLEKFEDACEDVEDSNHGPHLRHIGKHFFQATTPAIPTFDLSKLGLFLEAKKTSDVPAPDADDDIDWLLLSDNDEGETKGLKAVYRVETAGGRPPATCSGDEQVFVPYTAEYWFYA